MPQSFGKLKAQSPEANAVVHQLFSYYYSFYLLLWVTKYYDPIKYTKTSHLFL